MAKYLDEYERERTNIHKDFHMEIAWLAKKYKIKPSQITIDPYHPVGESVIFINGDYFGYVDDDFYKMMQGQPNYWDDSYDYGEEE